MVGNNLEYCLEMKIVKIYCTGRKKRMMYNLLLLESFLSFHCPAYSKMLIAIVAHASAAEERNTLTITFPLE